MERRPAVGAEDLSLQDLSAGSALFNNQSKCACGCGLIEIPAFPSTQTMSPCLLWLPPPDEIKSLPVQIPVVKPDPDRANPKIGVSALAFSSDSRYLATKNGAWMFS